MACAPGVLTAVSRTLQPHLPGMKPFVTGERSSRKKGQGASPGFREHLGPSISLSAPPRMGMPPANTFTQPQVNTHGEQESRANTDGKAEMHTLKCPKSASAPAPQLCWSRTQDAAVSRQHGPPVVLNRREPRASRHNHTNQTHPC